MFFICTDNHLDDIPELLFYIFDEFSSISTIGKDNLYSRTHFLKDSHKQISGFAIMHVCYCDHNSYKKAILVYYDMTLYAFYLFISVNTVQGCIISPFDTLAIHDAYTWLHSLATFQTDMAT